MKSLPETTDFWQHLTQEEQTSILSALKTQDSKSVAPKVLQDESRRILGPDRLYEASRATLPDLHCVWNVKQALNAGRQLARWGCSAVQYSNRLHIFGGRGNDSEPRNSFHVLDLDTLEIAKMNTQNIPTAREGHSCVAYRDSLIVYGGCYGGDDDPTRFNDVWILDLKAKKWTLQKTTGQIPPGQDGHVAALIDDKMIIYGGSTEKKLVGDLYILSLRSFTWEKLEVEGDDPQPRESMSLAICKSMMYIFGGNVGNPGESDTYTNDFFQLELCGKRIKSKKIFPIGPVPCPRLSHSLTCLRQNVLALFGGESNEKMLDDVWLYLIPQNIWVELKPESPIAPRIAHIAAPFSGKLLIYGGMGRNQTVKSDISILTFTEEGNDSRKRPKRSSNRTSALRREMEESKSSPPSEPKGEAGDDICATCGHNNVACNFLMEHPELGHCTLFFFAQCQVPVYLMEQLCSSYSNPSLNFMRIADILEGDIIHIAAQGTVHLRRGEIVKCPLGPQSIDFSFLPINETDDTFHLRKERIDGWKSNATTSATILHIYSPNRSFPPDTVAMMMTGTYEDNLISPLFAMSNQALMVSKGEHGLSIALTCRRENMIPCFFVVYTPDMAPSFPAKGTFYPNLAEILRRSHLTLEELQNGPTGTSVYLYVEHVTAEPEMLITNLYNETFNIRKDLSRICFKPPQKQQLIVQGQAIVPNYDEAAVNQYSEHKISERLFRCTYWNDTEGSGQIRAYYDNRLIFCTPCTAEARRKRQREDTTVAVIEIRDPKLVIHRAKVIKWNETTIGIINRVREEAMRAS